MSLSFRVVNELVEAEKIWRALCPQETIFDSWDYRMSFNTYQKNPIHFIVGENSGKIIGAWPLQLSKDGKALEFFGGDYMEDNRLLLSPETQTGVTEEFYAYLKTLDQPVYLQYIKNTDPVSSALPLKDYKYTLPLTGYKTYEDYFADKYADHGETRRTLGKKIRRFEQEPLSIVKNNLADLELLFEFTNKMFGDNSSFICRPFHKEIYRSHVNLPNFQTELLTFYHGDKVIAVSLAFLYQGSYAYINTGIDPDSELKGFSTYANIKNIQNAIDCGATTLDCFTGAYGWKDKWYFTASPQNVFVYPENYAYIPE